MYGKVRLELTKDQNIHRPGILPQNLLSVGEATFCPGVARISQEIRYRDGLSG
jgi:hypothetical protein